jgi:hypothetical protein
MCRDCPWASLTQLISPSTDQRIKIFGLNTNNIVLTVMVMNPLFQVCETGSPGIFVAGCVEAGELRNFLCVS